MKKLITIIATIAIMAFSFSLIPTASTFADTVSICNQDGVPPEVKRANGCGGESEELSNVVINIINGVVGVLGIVATVVIVIGGVNYMTSAGDPGKVKKAKDTILYAAIGLIICALAFAIVNFVVVRIINNETDEEEDLRGGGPVSLITE